MKKIITIFISIFASFLIGFLCELFLHQGIQHPDMRGSWVVIVPIYFLIIMGVSAFYTFLYQKYIHNKSIRFAIIFTSIISIIAVSRQIIFGHSLDFVSLIFPIFAVLILYFIQKK